MPIKLLLLYGSLGGLASVLIAAALRPVLSTGKHAADGPATPSSLLPSWLDVLESATHVFAGTGIGLLFWLSWGFAAIVTVPWWVRGLAFGGLCAIAIAMPALVGTAIRTGLPPRKMGALLVEWTYTCIMAALACAWIAEAVQ